MEMNIQLLILVLYIGVLFGISLYVKRRAANSSGFLFAGRKLTTKLVAANIAGTAIGAASTIGVAENAFQFGIAAGWYNVAWAAGAASPSGLGWSSLGGPSGKAETTGPETRAART